MNSYIDLTLEIKFSEGRYRIKLQHLKYCTIKYIDNLKQYNIDIILFTLYIFFLPSFLLSSTTV